MYMKKQATALTAILLVIAFLMCFSVFASAQSFKYGDANCDGKLNIKDATTIQRHAAMIIKLDETALRLADVNADGKVNVKDATMVQKFLAKLIASFPADIPSTDPTVGGESTFDSVPATDVTVAEDTTVPTSASTGVSTEVNSDPTELPSTATIPSDIQKPAKPEESKPVATDPEEIVTDPAETKPAETKPAETKPAETKPAETKPAPTPPSRDEDGYYNEVFRP